MEGIEKRQREEEIDEKKRESREKKIYMVLPADTNAARPREGTVKL